MPRRLTKSPGDIRAARRARRQAREQAAEQAAEQGGDELPVDIDEFRTALARRISRLIGNRLQYWRDCPERMCRRQHACAAPRVRCSNAPPLPPNPDGAARVAAEIQRALKSFPARDERS
jgi:hypothetical protein